MRMPQSPRVLASGRPVTAPAACTPGDLAQPAPDSRVGPRQRGAGRVAARRQRRAQRQHVRRVEAGVDVEQAREAARQQQRRGDQHHRRRRLRRRPARGAASRCRRANRGRLPSAPAADRPRDDWIAGTMPNRMPVATEIAAVNAEHAAVDRDVLHARNLQRIERRSARASARTASATPAAPPSAERTIDSVSSWRTIRPRPAPSTTRIASSFCRAFGAREQQVGDVGAGDQQHRADRAAAARAAPAARRRTLPAARAPASGRTRGRSWLG